MRGTYGRDITRGLSQEGMGPTLSNSERGGGLSRKEAKTRERTGAMRLWENRRDQNPKKLEGTHKRWGEAQSLREKPL